MGEKSKKMDTALVKAFIDRFNGIKIAMADQIEGIGADNSENAYTVALLATSVRQLESQASLSGLSALHSFFPAFDTLLKRIALPQPHDTETATDLLAKLFSALPACWATLT